MSTPAGISREELQRWTDEIASALARDWKCTFVPVVGEAKIGAHGVRKQFAIHRLQEEENDTPEFYASVCLKQIEPIDTHCFQLMLPRKAVDLAVSSRSDGVFVRGLAYLGKVRFDLLVGSAPE